MTEQVHVVTDLPQEETDRRRKLVAYGIAAALIVAPVLYVVNKTRKASVQVEAETE